ncbi:TRAP transporter small permease [Ramlibacter alkalitolerans]|uniref:TRAP transporter small permease protein n=1 Tax=Ramlibacter alkalitolerans TaxID=2039631 RepID=A0ABS1JWU7_9BURK|nr:TRAP transporter small permease subunit [Ramlibacter alkalitolerans]MBL0428795.1 TRAP transporter small permease subunit [Ramlibacter alkalitolerans]
MRVLETLAKFCAIVAGFILTGITLMTCVSLIGRNTTGATLVGDFELTAVTAGAAVALFLPWCQARRGNIIVDFFTAKAGARTNERLDRVGALLLGLSVGLLAWRTTLGGLSSWNAHSTTMMLGFPEWIVYCAMVPPLALTAVIGLWQAAFGFGPEVHE